VSDPAEWAWHQKKHHVTLIGVHLAEKVEEEDLDGEGREGAWESLVGEDQEAFQDLAGTAGKEAWSPEEHLAGTARVQVAAAFQA